MGWREDIDAQAVMLAFVFLVLSSPFFISFLVIRSIWNLSGKVEKWIS